VGVGLQGGIWIGRQRHVVSVLRDGSPPARRVRRVSAAPILAFQLL
jgi:hypothetical protein